MAPKPAPPSVPARLFPTRTLTFPHPPGPYTSSLALHDFGNLTSGWNPSRAHITPSNECRITLLKNALSASGGMIAKYNVPPGSEYSISFKVKFDEDFEWCTGGKFGPGVFFGEGSAAAGSGCDGTGASCRMVWHTHRRTGEVFFQVYVYWAGQTGSGGKYGDCWGRFPPEGSSLERGVWYDVKMEVKGNCGSEEDGSLRVLVQGEVIVERAVRWMTCCAEGERGLVRRMEFATFRGGATEDYMSCRDGFVSYRNVCWERIGE